MIFVFTILTACSPSKSSSPSSDITGPRPDRGGQNSDEQNDSEDERVCRAARIIKVLDNGKNIISRMAFDRSKIVNWNVNNGKVVSSLSFPVNLYAVSPSGDYILRRINYKRYQLIKFGDREKYSRVITINATYEPMPKLDFSPDGKFLVMNYVPVGQNYSHKIDIYSLEQEKFTSSLIAKNILFAKVTRDSQFYIVGFKTKKATVIQKVDTLTREVIFQTELSKYLRLDKLHIGQETFVVSGNRKHFTFDIETGEKLYERNLLSFIDMGSAGINGLVSHKWNEIQIIDLKTSNILFEGKVPSGLVLSTCQLQDNPLRLLCQDSIKQGSVSVWNVEQSQSTTSCF